MSKPLNYNGYQGSIEISEEDECLFGKVLHVNDLVTYEANTVAELKKEFQAAVDDYLETCRLVGKEPDKPFNGTFNVRVRPEIHKQATFAARENGMKLNEFVSSAIEEKLKSESRVRKLTMEVRELHDEFRAIKAYNVPSSFAFIAGVEERSCENVTQSIREFYIEPEVQEGVH